MDSGDARRLTQSIQDAIRRKAVAADVAGGMSQTMEATGDKLTAKQMASIKKSVLGKNPEQLRLPGLLWTRELVGYLIERRFVIRLSRWTVGRHLKEWCLTPQKPAKRSLWSKI